jgi:hypothetical protein
MKLNHKKKLKMARKMMTREEIKNNVSPFLSNAWFVRKFGIVNKIIKKNKENAKRRIV